jgi:CheY-like chemotaxis protein
MTEKTLSVLLVDDDPDTQNLYQLVMEHNDVELTVLRDAESALDYLSTNTPDIIVMDIVLPGIDGYQAIHQIRRRTLAPNACVIATTAYYTDDTTDKVLAEGFSGYLQKPVNPTTLLSYLKKMANKQ